MDAGDQAGEGVGLGGAHLRAAAPRRDDGGDLAGRAAGEALHPQSMPTPEERVRGVLGFGAGHQGTPSPRRCGHPGEGWHGPRAQPVSHATTAACVAGAPVVGRASAPWSPRGRRRGGGAGSTRRAGAPRGRRRGGRRAGGGRSQDTPPRRRRPICARGGSRRAVSRPTREAALGTGCDARGRAGAVFPLREVGTGGAGWERPCFQGCSLCSLLPLTYATPPKRVEGRGPAYAHARGWERWGFCVPAFPPAFHPVPHLPEVGTTLEKALSEVR